jgi:hypothetical protein
MAKVHFTKRRNTARQAQPPLPPAATGCRLDRAVKERHEEGPPAERRSARPRETKGLLVGHEPGRRHLAKTTPRVVSERSGAQVVDTARELHRDLHAAARRDDRECRAAVDRARPRRQLQRPPVGDRRLRAHPCGRGAGGGVARRHGRPQARLRARAGDLHRLVAGLRAALPLPMFFTAWIVSPGTKRPPGFSPARRRDARRVRRSDLRVRGRSRGGRCSRSRRSPRPFPSRPLGRGRRRHPRRRP